MFKKSHGDVKKSTQKFFDPKKDSQTKLKHLRVVLDNSESSEAKTFFEANYSQIYYTFYDVFVNVEADLKQRANKSHREELETVLYIFEKILVLLPELIHRRWQFHSIGRIIKKLLHTGNSLKIRQEGIRLFLIWYQVLKENAGDVCHLTYAGIVPKLGQSDGVDKDLFTVSGDMQGAPVTPAEVTCILPPQSGEKQPDDMTKFLLYVLLDFMVSQVNLVEWSGNVKEERESSFNFLFNQFKKHYLLNIFPEFNKNNSLFQPNLDIPDVRPNPEPGGPGVKPSSLRLCQEVVIKWMAMFAQVRSKADTPDNSAPNEHNDQDDSVNGEDTLKAGHDIPGSNTSTLTSSSVMESGSGNSSDGGEDHSVSEQEIIQSVLYGSKDNINILHEVFRQALLLPFQHSPAMRRVITVYREWLQNPREKPLFMYDSPYAGRPQSDTVDQKLHSLDNISEESSSEDSVSSSPTKYFHGQEDELCDRPSSRIRNDSYFGAMQSPRSTVDTDVYAGLQKTLQVVITNTANVFLVEPNEHHKIFTDQIDLCRKVINIYRYVVMNVTMEQKTWEQLLKVMLKVTSNVMTKAPPKHRERSLGGKLAQALFQTLIVTWIKANLSVHVSTVLWDEFLGVLSSLTQWEELIREWAKTMETLTRVLARQVYNVDLNDLPLDRLSEQKEKRKRGTRSQYNNKSNRHSRTFSRGWSRMEVGHKSHKDFIIQSTTQLASVDETQPRSKTPPSIVTEEDYPNGSRVTRQRSFSGSEASPSHSRSTSTVSETASLVRSNSDSNLADSLRMKGASFMSPVSSESSNDADQSSNSGETHQIIVSTEDQEVAYVNTSYNSNLQDRNSFMSDISSMATDTTSLGATDTASLMATDTASLMATDTASVEAADTASLAAADTTSLGTDLGSIVTDSTSIASGDSIGMTFNVMDQSMDNASLDKSVSDSEPVARAVPDWLNNECSTSSPASFHSARSRSRSTSRSGSPTFRADDDMDMDEGGKTNRGSPSPVSFQSRSRSPSPTHSHDLTSSDDKEVMKDSDTPDRESLHIEVVSQDESLLNTALSIEDDTENCRSVIAGGHVTGWTPETAVVLWRRMLGGLGDINHIPDPNIHAHVYEYLCDLVDTLIKIHDNQSVTLDNQSSPPPPETIPPLLIFTPWFFKALELPDEYKTGKLLAYRLLCVVTLRRHNPPLPQDHLAQFYRILHYGLMSHDQDVVNILVRHCGARFFSLPLPGATMLLLDFLHAANTIAATTDLKQAPRTEAVSILGSLLCFCNHFSELSVLQPSPVDMTIMTCTDVKDHLISMVLKCGKKEPAGLARCIAISSLGIFLYEELSHGTVHTKLKEAVNVLLAVLKFNSKHVAQVASDMLFLLQDHVQLLLQHQPELPKRIVEVMASTLSSLLSSNDGQSSQEEKRLLVSMMFCLLEWCMHMPLSILLDQSDGGRTLVFRVFRVLNLAVSGSGSLLTPKSSTSTHSFTEFYSQDNDIENVRDTLQGSPTPKTPLDFNPPGPYAGHKTPSSPTMDMPKIGEMDVVKLAGRLAMCHLVNHLGHFPMASGAAQLNTAVDEYHDLPMLGLRELETDIFNAPNVQFFVLNNSTLISFVEIPAELDVPGGGVTAGLTTAKTVSRVIIRDITGKYSWDSAILFGPPNCRPGSVSDEEPLMVEVFEEIRKLSSTQSSPSLLTDRLTFRGSSNAHSVDNSPTVDPSIHPSEIVEYDRAVGDYDSLDHLLQYIGHTSPECLLTPGEQLNIPADLPEQLSPRLEQETSRTVLSQKDCEKDFVQKHKSDVSVLATPQAPTPGADPISPFQICRMMLSQLGFMSWVKRVTFDLLSKNDQLLREIKNLDKQRCRETHKIAVIYVAEGQEDKQSILTNQGGSKAYEEFVASLGWEVDLETHTGFMGGLQHNKSTGDTAPYYATSTLEAIFHVATRMPSNTDDARNKKLRHLGNDEVQIVWCEHSRDYRRGIIPTEFGDIIIVIYPLQNELYRIQINRKPEVSFFGPLFDGAIVDHKVLPGLVRATAINASRTKRAHIPFYQSFFEERAKNLDAIIQMHKESTMFEEFAANVFAPVLSPVGEIPSAGNSGRFESGTFTQDPEAKHSERQESPQNTGRQSRGSDSSESTTDKFARRLSFKGRKSSAAKSVSSMTSTPPDSPASKTKR